LGEDQDSRSSTCLSDNGYRMYIITARHIISGELLKYRKGFCIASDYEASLPGSNKFGLTVPFAKLTVPPENYALRM
jgi:hypothetical protein